MCGIALACRQKKVPEVIDHPVDQLRNGGGQMTNPLSSLSHHMMAPPYPGRVCEGVGQIDNYGEAMLAHQGWIASTFKQLLRIPRAAFNGVQICETANSQTCVKMQPCHKCRRNCDSCHRIAKSMTWVTESARQWLPPRVAPFTFNCFEFKHFPPSHQRNPSLLLTYLLTLEGQQTW